jgi:hypothetical protein
MKKCKRVVLVAATGLTVLLCGTVLAFDDDDFQYWTSAGASAKINKDWNAEFTEEFRFGNHGGNLYYQQSDLGFVYSGIADWIDIGLNFGLVFEKDDKTDRWHRENRPHVNLTFKWKMWGLSLSDRNRFEYRDRENAKDLWRYRNKFTVKLPWKLTAWKLQPYVADEVFINLDNEHFNRNRFSVGVSAPLGEKLSADIYYMLQSSRKHSDYTDYHILGTAFKFKF